MKNNAPYLTLIFLLFVALKFWYTQATTESLLFFLKPVDKIVELAVDSPSQFLPQKGYFHEDLNIVIDRSCSGFNFWLICFVMLGSSAMKFFLRPRQKIAAIFALLVFSYFFTIFVNAWRIWISVKMQKVWASIFMTPPAQIHQVEGTMIYLASLILVYFTVDWLFRKTTRRYATPA